MDSKKHIQDELNELNSGLPVNGQDGPYAVPEGYFEGLAASVIAKVRGIEGGTASEEIAGLSPLLAGLSRSMPYVVPHDYFQSNIDGLTAFTGPEESLVLSFISKEMPYDVPTGYFANIAEQVVQKVDRQEARVVPMVKRKWMRMAVAAAVIGIVTLTGINYFNKGGSTNVAEPVAVEIKKASTEELDAFIKTTDVSVMDDQNTAQNTSEVKHLLKDVSDKELEAFLEQVPVEEEEFELN
jgi:hypothetical protein